MNREGSQSNTIGEGPGEEAKPNWALEELRSTKSVVGPRKDLLPGRDRGRRVSQCWGECYREGPGEEGQPDWALEELCSTKLVNDQRKFRLPGMDWGRWGIKCQGEHCWEGIGCQRQQPIGLQRRGWPQNQSPIKGRRRYRGGTRGGGESMPGRMLLGRDSCQRR